MHFERRLWSFTDGVRLRIAWATVIGLAAVGFGIARLGLLGWLIGRIFAGDEMAELMTPIALIAAVMVLRGVFEHWRAVVAHETAARVQRKVRRAIYDKIAALGPGTVATSRSGALSLSLIDGVEQLETYFGQFLPQFLIALLTPILIFAVVAWIDVPVAVVTLIFAAIALFAPALWHRWDVRNALNRQTAYAAFAAEFLDSIQGLATLKAFGQSKARGDVLEIKARDVFQRTMWVLATSALSRGITDSAIACGAAAALAVGAMRVESGEMQLSALLIILMLGVEVYRPMRELRTVLHQGMVGMSAAQGIYRILDQAPLVADAGPAPLDAPLAPTIDFDDVHFRYPGTRRDVHNGLDFHIAAGARVGVVGTSGGGKSSIVRLLLRFYDPDKGGIRIGGHDLRELSFEQIRSMISVVNQDTFLFHGTVNENICVGRLDATPEDVQEAARTANIHDFIMTLPQGYDTVIGEKGIKLSGGQRQRVAIARALLRDAPILVLDEALSAVDAENEATIQEALDRLMKGRTTLTLAHRLSSVIGSDRIIVLDDGRIVESGSHATLMQENGVYASLMSEQARERHNVGALKAASNVPTAETIADVPGGATAAPTEGIIAAEGLTWYQVVAALMKVIMPWKGKLTATFSFGVLRVLAFIGIGVLSAFTVYALKNGQPIEPWLWGLAILAPLSGILHWLESWMAHDMAFRLLAEMRIAAFRKLDELAPAYLVRRRTGDLMALATHDIELVEYFFAHTVAPAFVAILVPAAILAVLASQSVWISLALAPFLIAVGLSPLLLRKRVDWLGSRAREAAGELSAFAVDAVQGMTEIVAFQQETRRGEHLDTLTETHARLRLPFFAELTLQHSLLEVLTGLGGLAVVVTGGAIAAQGGLDPALLPLMTLLAMAAFLPVSEIAQIGRQLADTMGATRRVYALDNEPVPVRSGPGAPEHSSAAELALVDVDFSYPGQHRHALKNVNFTIPAGQTVALVGTSGAGKTTMAQLLMRFWDPARGMVTMNGVDLRQYELDDLRRRIALVAQDTYLFNDTLRANILIGRPDADDAALRAAVEHASLTDLVDALPEGLDTQVGERGTSLSGGQRQRVAIARAFLKDAPVLILDEATSHLDAVNEQALRKTLDRLQENRTTIVIAHRLSTIRDADLIVVLDEGKVRETGTHDALLAAGGAYAQLISRQMASVAAAD